MTTLTDDLHLARWIDDHGRRVSKWEAQFLDAVLRQLDRGQACTAKQRATLQRIYEERCAWGDDDGR